MPADPVDKYDREHRLLSHFENLDKQEHAARFGMWVFLASELLLFTGLFGLYVAYRNRYPAEFYEGVHHNALALGTTNTVVLIVSSFTVAWAIHAIRHGRRRTCFWMLVATIVLGATFLVIKGVEYGMHFHEGVYPGALYAFEELPQLGARTFFNLYFVMTGLHALHMIAGLSVMTWLAHRVYKRRTHQGYHIELEVGGLYWHLVDSIWIFLWPIFYLAG